ncbi:MAG: hypothetical protein LBB30_00785 [Candidatus Methanoplasma sp.]|jgi:hypothetical protein|nr:hypothetical protein [Candidatus Methanoplasma sp.]
MDAGRSWFALSIFISTVSVAFGIWGQDGAMTALSLLAVLFSVLSFTYCSTAARPYPIIASTTVLICTTLMVTVASYDMLAEGGYVSDLGWIYLYAVIRGIAVIPLIIVFFFTTAAVFKASYNWAVVSGLGWLTGMGMQVPQFAMVLILQSSELENEIIVNATIVIGMLANLVMFAAFSLIIRSVFKKNRYLITSNGLEVRK